MDCVWGEWKSSECSKAGERELTREVEIPKTLFGEACQGPDHKTEKCEMPKGMKTKAEEDQIHKIEDMNQKKGGTMQII